MTRRDALKVVTTIAGAAVCANPVEAAFTKSCEGIGDVTWVRLSNGHKVWTKRVGNSRIKLLLLHGGPGLSHDYMNCFADILPGEGYEVHLYDQLGCDLSDRPQDRALWTLERYVTEVEEVRQALDLTNFILIGHSWGSVLAIEYALRHQDRLRAMILSNMTASAADYDAYNSRLEAQLPDHARKTLQQIQTTGGYESPAYGDIIQNIYFPAHAIRMKPWPEEVMRSLQNANPAIGNALIGPDQFRFTGELEHWDRWQALKRITVPTLTIGAAHDFMNPVSIRREAAILPRGECFISQTGSHLAMWDDQKSYFAAVDRFLRKRAVAAQ